MRIAVVVSSRGVVSLSERLDLLREAADVDEVVVASGPKEALGRLGRGPVPYLLDVNRVSAGVAGALVARGRPYVLDTGDDATALARATRGVAASVGFGALERQMVRRARAVVCRGSFHVPVLRTKTAVPLWCAPDTVPDKFLDALVGPPPDPAVVSTFGSASSPSSGDRAYGWEVVDLVAANAALRGVIVVNGSGIDALRARAHRLGVADRVAIEGSCSLPDLATRLSSAAFVTSIQSDDLAGWVRTTGKLPIALGLGKGLVTTRVGEASAVLPGSLLVEPGDHAGVLARMADVIRQGLEPGWPCEARRLAERFRRSTVAYGLRQFLTSL